MRGLAAASAAALMVLVVVLLVPAPPAAAAHAAGTAPSSPSSNTPLAPATVSDPAATAAPSASSVEQGLPLSAQATSILDAVKSDGIPTKYVYLPNLNGPANPTLTNGHINISYRQAPAPMGVAEYGLNNSTGTITPFTLNTTSVLGTFSSTNLTPLYLDDDAPRAYGVQLNAVLNNVTLFGNRTFQFWTQNVLFYIPDAHTIQLLDNIWNFSNRDAYLSPNFAYEYGKNGSVVAPTFYYAEGPILTVDYPFTIGLYVNSTVIGGRDAVYFNYTLSYANLTGVMKYRAGSFDFVIFNSKVPFGPAARPAEYLANGRHYNPLGLVDDFELSLGGPGGGSTTSIFNGTAQMTLQYLNRTTGQYQSVPTAWNTGGDTGETVEGASVWYQGTTAEITAGPSITGGLWGMGVAPGAPAIRVSVAPANAFTFVGPTDAVVYGGQWFQWSPPDVTVVHLSPGSYDFQWDLSDYTPQSTTISNLATAPAPTTVNLVRNLAEGFYTPLWAFSNGELAAISSNPSALGTNTSQFLLINTDPEFLPLFGQVNDYLFPVFPAIFLVNTTDYVTMNSPVTYEMSVPTWYTNYTSHSGIPTVWYLQIEFFEAQHVSLINAKAITYWDFYSDASFESSVEFGDDGFNVIFWNSTNNLIAGNNFTVEAAGLYMYNGFDQPANNTIWGNTFTEALPPAAILGTLSASYCGLYEAETHDLVYNNFFGTGLPVISPPEDPYWGGGVVYKDTWNVTHQWATNVSDVVNGFALSGNILLQKWQGGNFWSTYGSQADPWGKFPVNVEGLITFGGDYLPLYPYPIYEVTVNLVGLPNDLSWTMSVPDFGLTFTATKPTISSWWPNTTVTYTLTLPFGWTGRIGGEFNMTGAAIVINETVLNRYIVNFQESGLSAGATWSITLTGSGVDTSRSTTKTFINVSVAPGTYSWTVKSQGYLTETPSHGSAQVTDANYPIFTIFQRPPATKFNVGFTETGLPSGSAWSIWVNGGQWSGSAATITAQEVNGSYTYTVDVPSGYWMPNGSGGSFTVAGKTLGLALGFEKNSTAPPRPTTGNATLAFNPAPLGYTLWFNGSQVSSVGGTYTASNLKPGVYAFHVMVYGYYTAWGNVSVTAGTTSSYSFPLIQNTGGGGCTTNCSNGSATTGVLGLSSSEVIAVIIALAIIVVVLGAVAALRGRPATPAARGRPRAPPPRRPGAGPATRPAAATPRPGIPASPTAAPRPAAPRPVTPTAPKQGAPPTARSPPSSGKPAPPKTATPAPKTGAPAARSAAPPAKPAKRFGFFSRPPPAPKPMAPRAPLAAGAKPVPPTTGAGNRPVAARPTAPAGAKPAAPRPTAPSAVRPAATAKPAAPSAGAAPTAPAKAPAPAATPKPAPAPADAAPSETQNSGDGSS